MNFLFIPYNSYVMYAIEIDDSYAISNINTLYLSILERMLPTWVLQSLISGVGNWGQRY